MYVLYASMRYMCCICFVRATPALPPSATKSDREKKAQKGALCRRCRRLLLSTWCTLFSVSCCCYFDGVGRYHRRRTSGPSLAVGQPRSTPCACCPMSPPSIDRSPLTLSLRTRCSLRTCFSSVCLFGGGDFVPTDTARTSALQCAYHLNIPFREGFIKNRQGIFPVFFCCL